ncbi:MAG TPA: methyltransferase domain-containing protein [Sediminibacterium sp.]|nr:methyltransferase domain-containing protein [Sediminibacterium sp.]
MPDRSWFKDWFNSPYYHLLYQNRDEAEAIRFIQTLIRYLHPSPGSRMVDYACGKGRHSIALAEMGFDVTGIDLSAESIAEARKEEAPNLHFYQHDMRRPFFIHYFGYAFNFFTSFGYFKTRREHDNAIRTIAQSLVSGGVFVLDFLNVRYAEAHLEKTQRLQYGEITFYISRWQDETHFYKQIQVTDPEHPSPQHLFTEKVAKFSLGDFTEMLAYQDMQVQEVFGDYELGRYDMHHSPRMILIARRK